MFRLGMVGVICSALASVASAQDLKWATLFDGPHQSHDYAAVVVTDEKGNSYVGGYSEAPDDNGDIMIVKVSAGGQPLWSRTYEGFGSGRDAVTTLKLDSAGNLVAGGEVNGPNGSVDLLVLKYSPSGTLLFDALYDGPVGSYDGVFSGGATLDIDANDNILIAGASYGGVTNYDIVTLKYDPAGTLLWESRYDNQNGYQDAYGLVVDRDGNVFVGGDDTVEGSWDFLVLKYAPDGTELWSATYDGVENRDDIFYSLDVDPRGHVYAAGLTDSSTTGSDYLLVKWNKNGVFQWAQQLDGENASADTPFIVAVDSAGRAVMTGTSDQGLFVATMTAQYDTDGNLLWERQFDLAGWWFGVDSSSGIVFGADDKIYISGLAYSGPTSGFDALTLQYDNTGTLHNAWVFDGPNHGNEYAFSVAMDKMGSIYTVGYGMGPGFTLDYLILKYGLPVGIGPGIKPAK